MDNKNDTPETSEEEVHTTVWAVKLTAPSFLIASAPASSTEQEVIEFAKGKLEAAYGEDAALATVISAAPLTDNELQEMFGFSEDEIGVDPEQNVTKH